ncbi:hypothetical protein V5N11_033008 [Cardamine amara subsp. amara]|uniref:Retrotransposon gag domain-containing protein n=1 Tax=Cardamine amara subsp. amara TaxID=228776 RepID=A0ABD1BFB4_CARAN
MVADTWMRNLEANFDASRCPHEFKVQIVEYFLDEDAYTWWESIVPLYQQQSITWEIFKKEFERKYFPPEARDRLESQFNNLEQGKMSVRVYETLFMRLRRYIGPVRHDQEAMIRKFLWGLRLDSQGRLMSVTYTNLTELVERAVSIEEVVRKEQDLAATNGATQPMPMRNNIKQAGFNPSQKG